MLTSATEGVFNTMRLQDLQEYTHHLTRVQGWGDETLETRLNYLKSEIKEAEEEIYLIGSATSDEHKEKHVEDLGLELFDVLWNVAELANRYGIDLEVAAKKKMMRNSKRNFSEKPKEFTLTPSGV